MKAFDQLVLVNYCHPGCVPLKNTMRLPEAQAFQLAQRLAEEHPETTAFTVLRTLPTITPCERPRTRLSTSAFSCWAAGRRRRIPCPLWWRAARIFAAGLETDRKHSCR